MLPLSRITVLICCAALTACGPQYRMDYTLTPPASPSGKQCANNCYYVREGCVNACQAARYDACGGSGLSVGVGYGSGYGHRGRHWSGVGYGYPGRYHDRYYDCRPDTDACIERCEIQYRQCFTTCGGRVDGQQVCTANCGG